MLTSKEKEMHLLIQQMSRCYLCPFAFHRTHLVPHAGSLNARCALIGEAPGREEDENGEAFVGPAGRGMCQIMRNFNLNKDHFYIANLLKCRPLRPYAQKDNATPGKFEVQNCFWYLWRQMQIVQPKLIVTVGLPATRYVLNLGTSATMTNTANKKGKLIKFGPYDVTWDCDYSSMWHPAAALHNPKERAKVNKSIRDAFYLARTYINS